MRSTTALETGGDSSLSRGRAVRLMLVYGGVTLVAGWVLIRSVLSRSSQLNMIVVMAATFAPLWLGAVVGGAVGHAARAASYGKRWLPAVIAALVALPAALLDPWAIVALGLGREAPLALELLLLALPVLIAAGFGYFASAGPAEADEADSLLAKLRALPGFKPAVGVIFLILLTLAVYVIIYRLILPQHNYIAVR